MTIEQMKSAIHEIYPKWNLEDKSDGQIVAIYCRIKKGRTKKKGIFTRLIRRMRTSWKMASALTKRQARSCSMNLILTH